MICSCKDMERTVHDMFCTCIEVYITYIYMVLVMRLNKRIDNEFVVEGKANHGNNASDLGFAEKNGTGFFDGFDACAELFCKLAVA